MAWRINTIDHFRDTNVIAGGGGWADTGTQTNLAWALHAGASYRASQNFAVEISYRYLNVGNGRSGRLRTSIRHSRPAIRSRR